MQRSDVGGSSQLDDADLPKMLLLETEWRVDKAKNSVQKASMICIR